VYWNMIKRRGLRGRVQSWLGWPVPSPVFIPEPEQVRKLVATAFARGYSRKARGLDVHNARRYAVIPFLEELSPSRAWMCLVLAFSNPADLGYGERPKIEYARIDVSHEDLESLPRAGSRMRDQLFHWIAWEAYRNRPPS
jgi:hypothetical protein